MKTTPLLLCGLIACCAAGPSLLPAEARAEAADAAAEAAKDEARRLADEGERLAASGDYRGAVARLRQADAKFAAPTIKLALAGAHEKLGELLEARAIYDAVAGETLSEGAPRQFVGAQEQARFALVRLEKVIPKILVEVVGDPRSVSLKLDGKPLSESERGRPVLVNPGVHRLVIEMPGQPAETHSLTLKEGETRHMQIRRAQPASAPGADERRTPQASTSYTAPAIAFGVGAAGLVVGAITGGVALSKMGEFRERCGPELRCPASMEGALEGARAAGHASTASFAVAGGGAALGALLLALPLAKSKSVSVGVGPSGVTATGRF